MQIKQLGFLIAAVSALFSMAAAAPAPQKPGPYYEGQCLLSSSRQIVLAYLVLTYNSQLESWRTMTA